MSMLKPSRVMPMHSALADFKLVSKPPLLMLLAMQSLKAVSSTFRKLLQKQHQKIPTTMVALMQIPRVE